MQAVIQGKNAESTKLQTLVKESQQLDIVRLNSLPAILSDENKKQLAEAVVYTGFIGDPITSDFQRHYMLSDLEFPTEEAKLAQSVNELNTRTTCLMDDAYQYKKTELEIEKLKLDKKLKLGEIDEATHKKLVGVIEAELIDLDISNKEVSLRKIEIASNNRFNEAMAWKSNVDLSLSNLGKKSIDEVDLRAVRMGSMRAKIKSWGLLYVEGSFEMTPSRLQAIKSEQKAFDEGVNEGMARLIQHNPEAAMKRAKELGIQLIKKPE